MNDTPDQTDGPTTPPSGEGTPGGEPPSSRTRKDEVSLLDILLVLARHKTLIVRTVLVFTLLGVTYSLLAPLEYTSETKVVREAEGKGPDLSGGLGGIAGGLAGGAISGILGGASSGLGPEALPEVLQGRTVRLSVARDTFRFPDAERPMTFVEYVNRPPSLLDQMLKYTIWLPWTLKDALGRAISDSSTPGSTSGAEKSVIPSEEEEVAIRVLQERVSEAIDEETGLMSIFVTAGGPQLASDLTESFLRHFTTRVRELRTEKVRKRLQFVEGRFQEVEKELETAEDRLAQFLERNQNPTTATLQFRRDRLQRQVTFKEQLYSKLQSQLTQTRLELQRKQPVVTTVEEPVPPLNRSSPQRTLIVIFSVVLGGFVGIGISFVSSALQARKEDPDKREKIKELREEFTAGKYWRKLKGKL